ncbi:MAG: translesion error-prone DNA polymerase V autoproteolytic subunit [Tatlockia sp.]|nr:translesion error-prone DNA polymerase V autoproteolytic subunit [Tatlockia sp.]
MVKGGYRPGSGRPRGGKYGEQTKQLRVPVSRIDEVIAFLDKGMNYRFPFYSSKVRAGFPSPADDYIERYLDLNDHLIKHPAGTFFVRASGDSMTGAGIHNGDLLVVDRSIQAANGNIVIAALNGELTVKRLSQSKDRLQLLPENSNYPPIEINEGQDLVIWGVVTYVIHEPA